MEKSVSYKQLPVITCDGNFKIISKNARAENLFPQIRKNASILRYILNGNSLKRLTVATVTELSYENEIHYALVLRHCFGEAEKYFFFFHSPLQLEYAENTVAFLYKISKDYMHNSHADASVLEKIEKYVANHAYVDEFLVKILKKHENSASNENKIYDVSEVIAEFCNIANGLSEESDVKIDFSRANSDALFAKFDVKDFLFILSCIVKAFIKSASERMIYISAMKEESCISLKFFANLSNAEGFGELYEKHLHDIVMLEGLCAINEIHVKNLGVFDNKISCEILMNLMPKNSFALADSSSNEVFEAIYKEILLLLGKTSNMADNT